MSHDQATLSRLATEKLLDAVPVANHAARGEKRGEALMLWVPLRRTWWMRWPFTWVLPYRSERGYMLDRLGAEVWRACDGQQTTEAIIESFAERHRLSFHDARLVVLQFLQTLTQRKLVALVVEK